MARDQGALSRRNFCSTLAGLLVAPGIAIAQASRAVRRIGLLEFGAPNPDFEREQADALRQLGWVEGQNLQVERRYANGRPQTLQSLAEALVRAQVDIIVTAGTPATLAAKRATSTIPIVFRTAGDPTMVDDDNMVRDGGALIAYTSSLVEQDRIRAEFIDRILRGAKPGDLPVRQPARFDLVINLKTAKVLGLTIPKELLLRADEVIQ